MESIDQLCEDIITLVEEEAEVENCRCENRDVYCNVYDRPKIIEKIKERIRWEMIQEYKKFYRNYLEKDRNECKRSKN